MEVLREVAERHFYGNPVVVGRHGAFNVVHFQRAGATDVEFGLAGGGYHSSKVVRRLFFSRNLPVDARAVRPNPGHGRQGQRKG